MRSLIFSLLLKPDPLKLTTGPSWAAVAILFVHRSYVDEAWYYIGLELLMREGASMA